MTIQANRELIHNDWNGLSEQSKMKAIVYTEYGSPDVLRLAEVEKPTPRENEVLIKNHATTVSSADVGFRSSVMPTGLWLPMRLAIGLRKPRNSILGTDFAGEVESVGKNVTRFQKGEPVFGLAAGLSSGTYAEYVCLHEDAPIALKPANLTYVEAASIPFGANTALVSLKDRGNIQPGQKVLIYGASGSVGTHAVQLAKHFGADVTAVCSTSKIEMVASFGADRVIDYTKEDFTQNDRTCDLLLDTVGNVGYADCLRTLKPKSAYLIVSSGLPRMFRGMWTSMTGSKKVFSGPAGVTSENLYYLKTLMEEGALKPVVDRSYPLDAVAEAHRYVDSGQKQGNVVITVSPHS